MKNKTYFFTIILDEEYNNLAIEFSAIINNYPREDRLLFKYEN